MGGHFYSEYLQKLPLYNLHHIITTKMHKTKYRKQNAQSHLGSNLTPDREDRNFRKTAVTNSTKPLDLEDTCRNKVSRIWCHCKIHQKRYRKKRRLGSYLTPCGRLRVIVILTLVLSNIMLQYLHITGTHQRW
jgi:hypothetical protein